MFLNGNKIARILSNSALNRKHEMFLNVYTLLTILPILELNRKHEMFLNYKLELIL